MPDNSSMQENKEDNEISQRENSDEIQYVL